MIETKHKSVLLVEAVDALNPAPGGFYIDGTCGLGGHSEALLDASAPNGKVLTIDRDPEALEMARTRLARFSDRVTTLQGCFSQLPALAQKVQPLSLADGFLADLGVSSIQLDEPSRGFSFRRSGPLDMRMGPGTETTAQSLLDGAGLDELTSILRDFGEVRQPRRVARAVLRARDAGALKTTTDLAHVVEGASYRAGGRSKTHPATQVFQAIRIAVNGELDELKQLLQALPSLVAPGGRAAFISFHSLEDRMVKRAFEEPKRPAELRRLPIEIGGARPWKLLTKKPIVPGQQEQTENPRARSAKLRVAVRSEASEAVHASS